MSNYLAIATVTAALQEVLRRGLEGLSQVGVGRPREEPSGEARVNLYLYRVASNPHWRNADLPTRDHWGDLVQKPIAALDLYYLISIYEGSNLLAERLLGRVIQTLHRQPVLDRDLIESVARADSHLSGSDLAQEPESIKLTPLPLGLEELSKLWSVFFQIPYVLSVAYVVGPVFIEAEELPRRPLPVRERRIYLSPFRHALLEQALSGEGDPDAIVFGGTLVLRGRGLAGPEARVDIGGVEITPDSVSDQEIRVPLTRLDLRAGVQGVRILYGGSRFGRYESNTLPVMIRPRIQAVNVITEDGQEKLQIAVEPRVHPGQRIHAYLNQTEPSPRAYVLDAEPLETAPSDTVTFALEGVENGEYLVRIEVDGAESLLEVDADGNYVQPRVTVSS